MGAAASGIAAAELLAHRGARVTLSEAREVAPEAERLRGRGVTLEMGGHQTDTFANADLVVAPNTGHSVYWEQPDFFNNAVLEFVGKHAR